MFDIERKKYERKHFEAEDIIIKTGKFRIYFQNYYTIIALGNDILLGGLFFMGSLTTLLSGPAWIRQWAYLIASFFMLMRPTLRILRNIFIYNKDKDYVEDLYEDNKKHNAKKEAIKKAEKENKEKSKG